MDAAVALEGVSYHYGAVQALHEVRLEVARGEIFGLVGPDGAGKTTLVRLLCGLLEASAGNAYVLGKHTQRDKRHIKDRIGYLSQRFSLYGDLSISENIDFFAEIHGLRQFKARKEELLRFTRLEPFRDRLADRLSGGMKQKLALACTLIHTPDIIFLDEPTTGVDPVSRRDFWKILNGLLATGLTILMSTPYLDEAERCNRVALMDQGRVLVCDSPRALRESLPYTFLEVVCLGLREAAAAGRQLPGVAAVQMFGDRIHLGYVPTQTSEEAVLAGLKAAGVPVRSVRRILPSLEDVFIHLVSSPEANRAGEGA